jgi:hypothetical protein
MLLAAYLIQLRAQSPDMDELAGRCAAANPSWAAYDEDLKAAIGAAAMARWAGALDRVERRESALEVCIRVEPPWSEYPFAIPILVRDPAGNVSLGIEAPGEGGMRVYRFPLPPGGAGAATPWVTVRYPRNEVRAVVPEQDAWSP